MADELLQQRTRFSDFTLVPNPSGGMYVVGYNPAEPNLARQNARYSFEAIRDYMLTGVPPSSGKWVTPPAVTVTDNGDGTGTIAITAGQADWDGEMVAYEAGRYIKPLPTAGLQRQDAIVATYGSGYVYVDGKDAQSPPTPPLPADALLANYVLLNHTGGEVASPPQQVTVVDVVAAGNLGAVTSNAVAGALQEKGATYLIKDGETYQKGDLVVWFGNLYLVLAETTIASTSDAPPGTMKFLGTLIANRSNRVTLQDAGNSGFNVDRNTSHYFFKVTHPDNIHRPSLPAAPSELAELTFVALLGSTGYQLQPNTTYFVGDAALPAYEVGDVFFWKYKAIDDGSAVRFYLQDKGFLGKSGQPYGAGQPAPAPAGASWAARPTISISGTSVNVSAGAATWNGATVHYPATTFSATLAANGMQRVDTVYAHPPAQGATASTYGYKAGPEGLTGADPTIPAGTLPAGNTYWNSAGGSSEGPGVNFDYASYAGKATPTDTAVFLVQETSGTKYKWNLAQVISWLGTKNIGGGAESVALGNRTTNYPLKFDKKYIITASIGAAIQITAETTVDSGFKPGTPSLLVLNCAAGFVPALPAPFVKKGGDFVAGTKNYVECLAISSTEILYEIYQ